MRRIWIYIFSLIFALSACSAQAINVKNSVEIHDIQGCSHTSPLQGKQVKNIEGIVTHKLSNGFTMQGLTPDDQDCSSEAIIVFTKSYPGVLIADRVRVNGIVDEFTDGRIEDHNLSQTEIVQPQYKVVKSNQAMPVPIILDDQANRIPSSIIENDGMKTFDPDQDGLDFYESLESMLVEIRSGLVVAPRNEFGEITILPEPFIKSNLVSPQGAILNTKEDANPEKIMIKLPSNYKGKVNAGDIFETPIIGVMDYSFGNYKVLAFSPLDFTKGKQVVDPFNSFSEGLTLATYNVENLSPLDANKKYTEISRQIVKILQSPDVLVLNEVMDNSGSVDDGVVEADETIQRLITAINKAGGPEYSFSDTPPANNQDGGIEGGNIRSVLIYRKDKGINLEVVKSTVNGIKFKDGKFIINQNPTLIGEFSSNFNGTRKPRVWLLNQNGQQFFVVGVHLTSQGASSPDWGNQQPPLKPEENQRIEETRLLNQQLSIIHALNTEIPIFIAGDMNDMPWSNAISALSTNVFTNTLDLDTPLENYSYIFEGNAQELDYILVNKNLAADVVQARFIHMNSFLDQSDAISDHDPMIIEFHFTQ